MIHGSKAQHWVAAGLTEMGGKFHSHATGVHCLCPAHPGLGSICPIPDPIQLRLSQGNVHMKLFAFRSQQARRIAKDSIRMYFAPVRGAFKGIRTELQKIDRDVQRHRNAEAKREKNGLMTPK